MQERCKKDLCYNCDKKYEFGHTCKKLFMLEVLGDEEVEQQGGEGSKEQEPEISLNVVQGVVLSNTMRTLGTIGGHKFVILVDSKSTHNIISANVERSLKLPMKET